LQIEKGTYFRENAPSEVPNARMETERGTYYLERCKSEGDKGR
jgi:hypothetical protein